MKTIINAIREICGLFVEDASFTAAILVWLLLAAFVLPHLVGKSLSALILFAGLAMLLLENVVRSARKPR